jgi:hypothetical protein
MMQSDAIGGTGSRETVSFFDMLIPPPEWEARGGRPQDALKQRFWGKSDAMQLLRGYIRSLQRSGLTAFGNNHTIARRHIIDLVVLAATPHQSVGETSLSGVAAALLHTILDHLASHFSDPRPRLYASHLLSGRPCPVNLGAISVCTQVAFLVLALCHPKPLSDYVGMHPTVPVTGVLLLPL